ncbi:hypothetical protein BO78DRAFT_115549 [Aspergillus sclerotiicarbonarius CBS 121057]|uniref:Secreted protein n=1 Tax=Aspergillus sclerotiicarbonarius (strain CBS 121057 / IBT 28362) TaxID=1448318 RepID=A0A319ERX6_ASPSB|nr:hypothetical protein BO78DRAFT_115549 [Aspergillus sclerotiicarbonarius CBS 121057]
MIRATETLVVLSLLRITLPEHYYSDGDGDDDNPRLQDTATRLAGNWEGKGSQCTLQLGQARKLHTASPCLGVTTGRRRSVTIANPVSHQWGNWRGFLMIDSPIVSGYAIPMRRRRPSFIQRVPSQLGWWFLVGKYPSGHDSDVTSHCRQALTEPPTNSPSTASPHSYLTIPIITAMAG